MTDLSRIHDAFSSRYWRFEYHEAGDRSLISFLQELLPHIDPNSWEERMEFGGVFINGIAADQDVILPTPAKIEYYEPKFAIGEAAKHYNPFESDYIVYEDTDLIICYKPNKLPSMPAKEQRCYNLKSCLEKHLEKMIHLPSRLDTSTQGLLIASKTERMHGPLQRLFEKKRISKFYLFEASSEVEWETLDVNKPIGKTKIHPVLREVNGHNAKEAQTILTRVGSTNFVVAKPLTGRTHQIRVHASYNNIPVVGDNFYGGTPSEQLHLLSFALSFTHPFSEVNMVIFLPRLLFPKWALPVYDDLRKILKV